MYQLTWTQSAIYVEINVTSVNEVRFRKLSNGAEAHDIPLTKNALVLHIKRENYQWFIWKHSL